MLSTRLTVCIFAWNEANRIVNCIRNFERLFPILVVDNCSTDATVTVCNAAGVKTVSVKNPGFIETPEVIDPVFEACATDYILIASVSEFIPFALLRRYAEIANSGSHDVACAYRQSITAGHPVPISGRPFIGNFGENRFFRRGAIDFKGNKVHGRGTIVCPAERVLSLIQDPNLYFYQFRDYDASKTEKVNAAYDDLLAKQRFEAGTRFSLTRAFLQTLKRFVGVYVRFGCWRYGMHGFLLSYYFANVEFTVWLRIWEWENAYDISNVKLANLKVRNELELKFVADRSVNELIKTEDMISNTKPELNS